MLQLLEQWNEKKFIDYFEKFKSHYQFVIDFDNDCATLLEAANSRNMGKAVAVLLKCGTSMNVIPTSSEYQIPPAFVACYYGHHEVLKVMLNDSSLKFETLKLNLLHQICFPSKIHKKDRQKCFDLLIADPRCTQKIINGVDNKECVPLFYACKNGFDKIAIELMRRGAFIGDEYVINSISKPVLKEFLDECIKGSDDVREKNCEIYIDYRCLVPVNVNDQFHLEVSSVRAIADNSKLKELMLHPLISSFLYLKWRKIKWLVYFNLLVYFCFMMFLGVFIINLVHFSRTEESELLLTRRIINSESEIELTRDARDLDKHHRVKRLDPQLIRILLGGSDSYTTESKSKNATRQPTFKEKWNKSFEKKRKKNATSFKICVIGVVFMVVYEVLQCVGSYRKYFFKLSNWLDIILIYFAYKVLSNSFVEDTVDFRRIRSVTILMMGAQIIQLIANISVMSIHMAIFKRVCTNFLKTIALYLILILAFAMSFYTMKDQDENTNLNINSTAPNRQGVNEEAPNLSFSNPFIAVITTVRMMLSDFDSFELDGDDYFQGFIFLLFVVLITIVLFNLLNALAISDTIYILKDAELVDIKKRISILNTYEKLFHLLGIFFANILPEFSLITITPNKSNIIKVKKVDSGIKDVKILIQKTEIDGEIESSKPQIKMDEKTIEKIIEFVSNQQKLIL